jgi:Zn-dependent M32 family carboxypeptidase
VALALGFDTNKGRLDVSVHPFTGAHGTRCARISRCQRPVCAAHARTLHAA